MKLRVQKKELLWRFKEEKLNESCWKFYVKALNFLFDHAQFQFAGEIVVKKIIIYI